MDTLDLISLDELKTHRAKLIQLHCETRDDDPESFRRAMEGLLILSAPDPTLQQYKTEHRGGQYIWSAWSRNTSQQTN